MTNQCLFYPRKLVIIPPMKGTIAVGRINKLRSRQFCTSSDYATATTRYRLRPNMLSNVKKFYFSPFIHSSVYHKNTTSKYSLKAKYSNREVVTAIPWTKQLKEWHKVSSTQKL